MVEGWYGIVKLRLTKCEIIQYRGTAEIHVVWAMKHKALVLRVIWRENTAFCSWPKTLVDLVRKEPRIRAIFLGEISPVRS